MTGGGQEGHDGPAGSGSGAPAGPATLPAGGPSALRPAPRRSGAFSALRHRNFRLFFSGQLISLVGIWMQQVALAWMVLELTNSAWFVGLVNALESIPVLVLALYAGVVIDRVSRHRLVIVTKAASMVLALVLAALAFAGVATVWPVMVVATLLGVVNAFDIPARHTLFGDLVGKDDLVSAVALNSSSFNATRVVGPAIAGVVLSVLGAAWCFLLNGLSYVAVLWGLAAMDMPDTAAATLPPRSALANMAEGLRHVWRDTRMRAVILLLAVLVIFGSPFLVLLPILARDVLGRGAVAYGWMMAAVGAGALAGALWIASYGRRLPRGAVMLRSAALYAILLMVLALQATLPAVLLTLAALGCVMIVNGAIANTLLQTLAPDPLRGRIISVYTLVAIGFSPLGAILAGGIGDTLGVEAALVLGGVVCLVGALVVGVALRGLRETR